MATERYGEDYHKALKKAAKWHGGHRRKGTDIPYITHLLTVSALVWEDGGTEAEAIAALLHDTVEDGKATLDQVRDAFGDEVAIIVDHCSDAAPEAGAEKPPWFERKVAHISHLRGVASRSGAEPTMRVVGADKLANLRSVLVDTRGGTPDLWSRFKGGLGGSAWYYSEMAPLIGRALSESMLARELALAVDTLDKLAIELTAGSSGPEPRIASVLGFAAVSHDVDATRYLAIELARVVTATPESQESAVISVLLNWFGQPPPGSPARADLPHGRIELLDSVLGAVST